MKNRCDTTVQLLSNDVSKCHLIRWYNVIRQMLVSADIGSVALVDP